MMHDAAMEIRDYAKEEFDKVREEMKQFATVLDSRFSEVQVNQAAAEIVVETTPGGLASIELETMVKKT